MAEGLAVFLYAVAVWLVFMYVLKARGFSYIRTPLVSALFYLLAAAGLVMAVPSKLSMLFIDPPLPALVFLAFSFLVCLSLYAYARQRGRPRPNVQDLELLALDYRFLVPKTADVLFQQASFGVFLLLLTEDGVAPAPLVGVFVFLFFVGHLGMFLRISRHFALLFLLSSLAFSIPLALLLLYVPGGVYYAIGIHMLWYALIGAAAALLSNRHT